MLPIFGELDRAAKPGPAPRARGDRRLLDSHGRTIRDLRLSVTDRCNFRCVYCMEPDVRFMGSNELLSIEEMARVARVCAGLGIEKIRVTGGEPTVRTDLAEILAAISRGVEEAARPEGGRLDLAMTTNGSLMDEARLGEWRRAGLKRITVSIDSLDAGRFARVTRSASSPGEVVEGIRAAKRAGFDPVKVNAVVVRGFNEDDVPGLAALARELAIDMRYIEFMPLDSGRAWDESKLVPASEIVERIGREFALESIERDEESSTALLYRFADGSPGRIGVIAPVTRTFCGACSRLRITADGKVRPCLFSTREWDLRPLLREGGTDGEIEEFLMDVTWTKQAGHGISSAAFEQPARPMSAIGG
ncbi:MAG: GTP 3',8-cyclase MoaA [Phycisphaerales bacterium]